MTASSWPAQQQTDNSRAARHTDSENSTPHALSSSDFLAQVLIDQLGFNASPSEE
jgi:hypothetical protein